jgi:hypothetical protein
MIVNVELDNQVLPFGVLDRGAPNGTKSEAGRREGGRGWLRYFPYKKVPFVGNFTEDVSQSDLFLGPDVNHVGLAAEEGLFQVLHRLCDKNRHLKRLSHEIDFKNLAKHLQS